MGITKLYLKAGGIKFALFLLWVIGGGVYLRRRFHWGYLIFTFLVLIRAETSCFSTVCIPAFARVLTSEAVSSAEKNLENYFRSSNPDFESVKELIQSLEVEDMSDPEVQASWAPTARILEYWARIYTSPSIPLGASEGELLASSNKLRFLNTPVIRGLLHSEILQSQVGRSDWFYKRAIWNRELSVAEKITSISHQLDNLFEPVNEPVRKNLQLNKIKVEVLTGDLLAENGTDAIVATIECGGGLCSSEINSALRSYVEKEPKAPSLKDGESLVIKNGEANSIGLKNIVIVVDNQKLPLREILKSALITAEAAGFKSVALPVLRTGYAFGSVETSYHQVLSELKLGIESFQSVSDGTLTKIKFTSPKNNPALVRLHAEFPDLQNARERSLRNDLRPVSLSGQGFTIEPNARRPKLSPNASPIYREMLRPWDLSKMMEVHLPIHLGQIEDTSAFSRPTVSVLNMPIKFPGTTVRVPIEHDQFREFLQRMVDHELEANPQFNDFYAYFTVDQGLVRKATTQRRAGIHIDGVQGARYKVKLPPEHTYSASDKVGTVFYDQVFDLRSLDPDRQHVHAELERQAKPENKMIGKDYGIYFWDSYSVHEAGVAENDVVRTFVRVEFSKKIYDGFGDTESPLFDYHWPRVPRPIPANLDDTPISKINLTADSSPRWGRLRRGYSPEIASISAWAPHTVKNLHGYLADNLGNETVASVKNGKGEFLIVVGDGSESTITAKSFGWTLGAFIPKKEGFHRVYEGFTPQGKPGFVILRVNGDDRVVHIQSLLKLAGVPEEKVHTIGNNRSWRDEYLRTFNQRGYVPDLVVYGFANTAIDGLLLINGFKNGRHFATLKRNYKKKKEGILTVQKSDLEGMNMQVLELADGRKIWFLHCMFGDLARDLVGAIADHGAKNITFIGSAGSLDPNIQYGSVLTPKIWRKVDGSTEILNNLKSVGVPVWGQYMRVPTPNIGTEAWVKSTRKMGVDIVESELGHILEEMRRYPEIEFRAALVITEIALGPNHQDMTEWGYEDLRRLIPDLKRIVGTSLDSNDKDLYVVKKYESFSLLQ